MITNKKIRDMVIEVLADSSIKTKGEALQEILRKLNI